MDEAATAAWDLLRRYRAVARCDEKLIDDYMWMGPAASARGVIVWQFKHRGTRHYLVIDGDGHSYRFDYACGYYRPLSAPLASAPPDKVLPMVETEGKIDRVQR